MVEMFFLNCSKNELSLVLPVFTIFPWLFIAFNPDSYHSLKALYEMKQSLLTSPALFSPFVTQA